jgi:hypothetical protein
VEGVGASEHELWCLPEQAAQQFRLRASFSSEYTELNRPEPEVAERPAEMTNICRWPSKRTALMFLSRSDPVLRFVLSRQRFVLGAKSLWGPKAARKSGNDGYDKFSLPTGSGLTEDMLQ